MLPSGERVLQCPQRQLTVNRRWKSVAELAPNCPRCDSSNTKFCYYNNYSLTQPRYFCRGCRRYWTRGGSLRNVPIGGGCRKNRRGKSDTTGTGQEATLSGRGGSGGGECLSGPGEGDSLGSFSQTSIDADASTIDLAALYARFLRHQQDFNAATAATADSKNKFDAAAPSSELSSGQLGHHSPVQFSGEQAMTHCSLDGILDPLFAAEFSTFPTQNQTTEQTFTNFNPISYDQPSTATSEAFNTGDTCWASSLPGPNYAPEPQGLDSFTDDHLLSFQPNFLNSNWSSFDSTCNPFNRP